MSSVPPLLLGPILVLLLSWFMTALGYRVVVLTGIIAPCLRVTERGLVYLAIGAGVSQYLPFLLGSMGILSIRNVKLAIAALALLLARDLLHVAKVAASEIRGLCRVPTQRWLTAWLLILTAFGATLLLRASLMGSLGDDDGYHLLAPKRWLQSGTLEYLPTYTHTNAPMGFEMLYAIALSLGNPAAAKLLHFGAGALCLLALFLCAKRLGHAAAGVLAISCLLLETPLFDLPVLFNLAYTDLAVCWLTLTSLLLWLIWLEHDSLPLLMGAALCAGFAGSFKFTALSVGAGLMLLVYRQLERRNVPVREMAVRLGTVGALSAAPVLPWLWRNWRVTGNPVYPILSTLLPTRDWSNEHAQIFSRFFRYYNWGQGYGLDFATRKLVLIAVGAGVLGAYAIGFVLVKQPALRDLLLFSALLIAPALPVTGLYFRFWLPATICTILVTACVFARHFSAERLIQAGLFLLLVSVVKWGRWARYDVASGLPVALGLREERRDDQFWRTWRYVNENTPQNAHVLMAAFYPAFQRSSGVAFWVDRATYNTDSHLQDFIQLRTWDSFVSSVEKAKIDFVVVWNKAEIQLAPGFSSYPAGLNEYSFSRRLVDECGSLVFRDGQLEVYRLAGARGRCAAQTRSAL
jgi:hypothetical protein